MSDDHSEGKGKSDEVSSTRVQIPVGKQTTLSTKVTINTGAKSQQPLPCLQSDGNDSDNGSLASIFSGEDSVEEPNPPVTLGKRTYGSSFGAKGIEQSGKRQQR